MLGSLVHVGGLSLEDALDIRAIDGARLGDELDRIGYAGSLPCPGAAPHVFVELHVEQGPVLEAEGITIGAVTGVQGISWQEVTISGQSNHAGTTPMRLRHDPAYVAAEITVFLRRLAQELGGNQVCTVGSIDLHPNLVNVVPATARLTLDVRNTDESVLQGAEALNTPPTPPAPSEAAAAPPGPDNALALDVAKGMLSRFELYEAKNAASAILNLYTDALK
jgi:N-carbamoyl-L-amino-acid hydrolase